MARLPSACRRPFTRTMLLNAVGNQARAGFLRAATVRTAKSGQTTPLRSRKRKGLTSLP